MKEGEASGGIHQTANDMSDMEKEKESGGEEEEKKRKRKTNPFTVDAIRPLQLDVNRHDWLGFSIVKEEGGNE